jgi:glutaredoxin
MAEASKKALDDYGKFIEPVVTLILPYTSFYPAEDYHRNYAVKNPREYERYKKYSGRKAFIERNWEKDEADEIYEGDKVDKTGGPVIVYSTPRCQNCNEIKEFLRERGVSFREIDISADVRARDLLIEKTGRIGAPVVQIGDEFIFGLDPKKMEHLLQKERRQEQVIVQTHNP